MPERWRRRLRHQFWRAKAFRSELKRLTTSPARSTASLPRALIDALDPADPARARPSSPSTSTRKASTCSACARCSEIAEGLLAIAADAKAEPLKLKTAAMIDDYLGIKTRAPDVPAHMRQLARDGAPDQGGAAAFERRSALLKESGVALAEVPFSGEFGRNVAYYSGFVFEVMAPALGSASPIAGGGATMVS